MRRLPRPAFAESGHAQAGVVIFSSVISTCRGRASTAALQRRADWKTSCCGFCSTRETNAIARRRYLARTTPRLARTTPREFLVNFVDKGGVDPNIAATLELSQPVAGRCFFARLPPPPGIPLSKEEPPLMKLLISASFAVVATIAAGAANAPDLPLPYKAAPAVPAYSWQGFYSGANGGFAWGSSCWTFVDTVPPGLGGPSAAEGCHDPSGGIVGGQVGYDWQLSNWVLGLEAQGDWASLQGQNVSFAFPTTTNRTRVGGLGLFTGRVGYTWSSALFYLKGGARRAEQLTTSLARCSVHRSLGAQARPAGAGQAVGKLSTSLPRTGRRGRVRLCRAWHVPAQLHDYARGEHAWKTSIRI